MIFNKKQIAGIFNVTIRTISNWESKGIPLDLHEALLKSYSVGVEDDLELELLS